MHRTTSHTNPRSISGIYFYRLLRSWAKVIFSQAAVCPQGGGVFASVHAWIPPGADTPPGQGNHPPPPRGRHPPGADPPEQTPPGPGNPPPPREADSSIRSTSGRYASYWNSFLSYVSVCQSVILSTERGGFHVTIIHDALDFTIWVLPSKPGPSLPPGHWTLDPLALGPPHC